MIQAEAHSDDYVMKVRFDATPWFKNATTAEIVALAKCGWGGDYAADAVAIARADHNRELQRLFNYLELIANVREKKDVSGFECHVNEKQALMWLYRWNFRVWKMITEQPEQPPDKTCPCGRVLRANVIQCGACAYEYTETEVLKAIYQL